MCNRSFILSLVFLSVFFHGEIFAQFQLGRDIDGEASDDQSGYSVSIDSSGNRVAIGATDSDGNGSNSGHVRVYEYSSGSWTQMGSDIDGEASADYSGQSVSVNSSGDRVAIGVKYNDGNGNNSGHVRVYEYSSGSWTRLKMDIDGEASYDHSGQSVSINSSGDRVAIGAPDNDGNGGRSGHVRVFDFSGGPVWHVSKTGSDSNNGTESSPFLTIQRAINAAINGDTILVASGIYTENITCTSDKNITLASLYLTTQDTSYISSTIINGDADDVVLYMHMNSGSLNLVGLTLTNGAKGEYYGGGLHVVGLDTLIIDHVVVRNNTSEDCCGTSGGVYTSGVDYVRIENSKISDNRQPDTQGGGLNVGGAKWFKMTNTLIEGNTTKGYGAANIYSDEIQIINCTIANNKNDCQGCTDGLYVVTSSSLDSILIMNTIVAQNSSWDNSDEVYDVNNRDMGFSTGKVVLINNYTGLYYHVGQDRVKRSVGNIFTEADPFLDMSKDNYGLTPFSHAIAGGLASVFYDGNTVSAPTKDINGLSRGALPDMGAIENSLNKKLTVAYVSKNGSDSNVGTSASPFLTVQKGINATSGGDTVLVASGTYTENITHTSGTNITLASQYLTTQDTSYISSTIIDGNENGPVIYTNNSSTSLNLIGLTLTNGGAIDVDEDDPYHCSSCVIGGGIYGYQGDTLVLDHTVIRNNSTESTSTSGGVHTNNFNYVKITDTKIADNISPDYYNVLINTDDFEMTNTLVEGNESSYAAVVVSISNDVEHMKIVNNTVANNKIENSSQTFLISLSSGSDSVLFMNNIVSQNYQYNSNEDRYDLMYSSVEFYNGKIVMLNNYVNPGISGSDRIKRSSGNFFSTTSPFVNSAGGDYSLGIFSGAVGNGIASAHYDGNTLLAPTKDINDVDRPNPSGSSPDMGALESSYAEKLNIINVSTAGSDSNIGTEESPLLTIQRALDIASSGDTVLLAQGTYSENVSLLRGLSVTIGSRYLTTKDTSYISATVINGNNQGPTIHIDTWDKDKASMYLSGVTVTGGNFDEDVYVPCSPCFAAGAIFAFDLDTLFVDHVTIKNNTGHEGTGGGIRVTGNSQTNRLVKITNSNIYNNTSYYGQPVYINHTTKIEISNTIISNNNTQTTSAGLSFDGSDTAIVVNTTIANNKNVSDLYAMGLDINMSSALDSVLIMNSIISQNKGYSSSADSFFTYYEQISINNGRTVFLNNYTSESFSDNSKIKRSSGNVFTSADPFVNIDQNNYALRSGSSAIGKGTVSDTYYGSTIMAPSTDIFGNSRPTPNGTNPDIGAIENNRSIRDNVSFSVKQDGTGDYQIIQSAINNSDIMDGDTVLVYPGTYTENFYISGKNVVLTSFSGPFETHIVPNQPSTHTLTLSNTNSEITGFSFSGSSYDAASVDASGGAPRIANCRFYDNQSNNSIKFHGANAILENILFYNYIEGSKNGFYWNNSCSPLIRNSTIINYGGSVFNGGDLVSGSIIQFENCIIKGRSEQAFEGPYDITHSAVSPDIGGATNLSLSRERWSNVFKDTVSGDYRLSDYSPCIGAGSPINAPVKDLYGNPRPDPVGSSPDLGAFESVYSSQRPQAGSVVDGLGPGADITWSNSTSSLSANWWGFTDNDILSYQYAVGDLDIVSDAGASYLTEDFNSSFSSSIPDGWTQTSFTSDGSTRNFDVQGNNGVNNSRYVRVNVYVVGDIAALISPEVGPVNEGDSLFFYYRAIDYSNEGSVMLNNGDGISVYFEASGAPDRTLLWSIDHNHSPTSEWQEVRILMPSFSGKSGNFVFEAYDNGSGNDWYACFDQIRVSALAVLYGVDNVLPWTSNGTDTSAVISGLNLIDGESYSVGVRAIDQDSQVSDTVYTDGVTVDATPPVVYDAVEGYVTEPQAQSTYSLVFDGTNGFVEIPHSGSLDLGDGVSNNPMESGKALTIATWLYPTIHDGESTILMKGQYGYGFALTWDGPNNCSPNNAQNLVYWDQSGCWETINSTITYEFDQWQHMAVTVEDIGNELEIYFYVNGVQDGPYYSSQPAISNGGGWAGDPTSLRIGDQGGQGTNSFSGNISSLAIWNSALSENTINTMAGEHSPTEINNLVAHWDFSDGSGSVLTDQTNNGNNGNISGAFWSDDIHTPPFEGEIIDMDFQNSTTQIQVFWSGHDDNSGIEYYQHSVGTYPGGIDASPWTNIGTGTTDIITGLSLADGQTYYLNVRAWDIAGNVSAVASSDGVVIDISPPTGTVVNDGSGDDISYTASDTALSANWPAFTEEATQITKYEVSLGTAAGNTNILDWVDNGLSTSFSMGDMSLTSGVAYFVNVRAGDEAGNVSDPISSDGVVVDTQGPDNVFVFDGLGEEDDDWTNSTETISAYWHFNDPLSGIPSFNAYEYAIGITPGGTQFTGWTPVARDSFFTLQNQQLIGGSTYYVSVRATDVLGNQSSVAISDGITVDVLLPTVGIPLDGSSQEDLDWQSSTNSLSVHWTATDTRDRQMDYFEYAVSTVPGDSNMVSWTNAGANNSATITGLSLSEGITYYSSIRAYDAAGNRSSAVSTDGITVDITPPVAGGVTDGQGADISFTASGNSLEGHWTGFDDGLSGLSYYHAAAGTNIGSWDVVPWTSVSLDTQVVFNGLSLISGQAYYLSVKAYDRAQNASQTASSNGVVSDQTGPEIGYVSDGISEDIEWVISSSELEASWNSFNDPLSGIKNYEYAVGDSPEGVNILSWTNIGLETQVLIQGLPLSHGSQYYIGVRGIDSVDNIGPPSFSNGLTVDLVLPDVTGVIESETAGVEGLDLDYMNQADTIIISWSGQDALSGVEYFETSLGTVEGSDDIVSWKVIDNPNIFSDELFNLGLQNGAAYFANVRARDVAGNLSDVVSGDGVLIDLTPPLNGEVIDGQIEDLAFTSSSDTLISSWSGFSDDISGIEYFEYSIGITDLGGAEVLGWVSAGPDTEFFLEEGLLLENAQTYYAAVRATDFAGNVSNISVSNGITVDLIDLELLTSTLENESYLPMDGIPVLSYSFSEDVKSSSVEISGNVSGSISTTMLDSSISIEFLGPFASLDTFNIITFVDDYSGKDSLTLDYTFYTDLLADYNRDLTIDIQDLSEFVTVWNNTDLTGELGPFTGTVPQVTVSLDGALDLRDVMAFTRMWHWSHATPLVIAGRNQEGPDLIAVQDGNGIVIMPPQGTVALQVAVKYPAEARDIIMQPDNSQIEDEIKLSKKEKENGIVLVEKAFLKERMEKKVILETISLDKNPAAIDIHYISYGKDRSVISSGVKVLDIIAVPHEFALRQNYPNPFNPVTHVRYEIPENGPVEIIIYDILGKEVAGLLSADMQAGYHSIAWRGLNKNGQPVGAGVYFAQFRSKGLTKTIKMLLLK